MNKQECDIIKDLSAGYIEGLLNLNSKIFVEKHLSNCDECKKYYNDINSNILDTKEIIEERKDKIEINYFKKVKNHINILKISLIAILICIFTIISGLFIKYYTISNIIEKAYIKTEYMRKSDNYKLTKRMIHKKSEEDMDIMLQYYYKDGKYKVRFGNNRTTYLEDNSYNKICVYDDLKQIEYYKQDFIEARKGNPIDIYYDIMNYKNIYTKMNILGLSLRKDEFEGVECYVIRQGNKDNYRDIWIDKKTSMLIRTVKEEKSKNYYEEIYTFLEDATLNEDVDSSILNTQEYQEYTKLEIINNATEEVKLYYELLTKNGKY